jgi:DNA modification methylase
MAMRFAGFEVRDCIQWLYGVGFPKSHNISKAIDKMGGQSLDWFIDYILKVAEERGITKKELTMLFPSKNGNSTGWLWNKQNNQSITLEQYNIIKEYLKLPFENIEEAKREVIGKGKAGLTKGDIANFSGETEFDITAPSTDAAKLWEGWGTALKPANEPIVLARKPLEKGLSIAENILKWGVGGINIDASRIGLPKDDPQVKLREGKTIHAKGINEVYSNGVGKIDGNYFNQQGRFPANIILSHHEDCECKGTKKVKSDGHHSGKVPDNGGLYNLGLKPLEDKGNIHAQNGKEEVENWDCHEDCPIRILDEQSGVTKSSKRGSHNSRVRTSGDIYKQDKDEYREDNTYGDKGGASRFFYVAKASKAERNKGLDEFEEKRMEGRDEGQDERSVAFKARPTPMANVHPTVKPVKLMQYLVKMITPPNGIVLDPFCGSGTTGVACKLDGFQFVGLEQDPEYAKIAEARIANYKPDISITKKSKEKPNLEQIPLF